MKLRLLLLLAVSVILSSCGTYKRLAYVQDLVPNEVYDVAPTPETRIVRGDVLNIQVLSSQQILAAPFNMTAGSKVSDESGKMTESIGQPEYTVDTKGRIIFPVIGPVLVEGLTLNELKTVLTDEILKTQYIKDPMVVASFKNFKVTVLGEVAAPGNYSFPSGEVNVFELLAEIGDMTEDAQRDNIWVIRTTAGKRKVYQLNAKSKDIFDSPAYYMQQNDIVYVAPKDSKLDSSTKNVLTLVTAPLAMISSILSTLTFLKVYSK